MKAKEPRTERGRKTLRRLLEAAALEFGERGFHDAAITGITKRAGVALGSFYTYFDSKEEVFRALVRDMSGQVRDLVSPVIEAAPDPLSGERASLHAFLEFVRSHKEIYRIIDEAEFVDHASYKLHYEGATARIERRLRDGAERGELRADVSEIHAWAVVGMNVFLGLRYGVWSENEDVGRVAEVANDFLRRGLQPTE